MLSAFTKMKKKAMAIQTLIPLIIALVVILIMWLLLADTSQIVTQSGESCITKGGSCVLPDECEGVKSNYKCETKEICCLGG